MILGADPAYSGDRQEGFRTIGYLSIACFGMTAARGWFTVPQPYLRGQTPLETIAAHPDLAGLEVVKSVFG
jgi:hypothetical protein